MTGYQETHYDLNGKDYCRNAYVYSIIVDGVERYIGKGSRDRYKTHLRIAIRINEKRSKGLKVKTSKFYNRLSKAIKNGSIVEYKILSNNLTHDEAFEKEILEISIRDFDQLWNEEYGGMGAGRMSDQQRENISIKVKDFWNDPEKRQMMINIRKQKIWDNPIKRQEIINSFRFERTEEIKEKLRNASKAVWANPEKRQELVAKLSKPELKEKRAIGQIAAWNDPNKRAKRIEKMKNSWTDKRRKETSQIKKEVTKEIWKDPAKRKNILEGRKTDKAKENVFSGRKSMWERRKAKKQEELDKLINSQNFDDIDW